MSELKNKKYYALLGIVLLVVAIIGLFAYGKVDKYEGLVKVKKISTDTRVLSASVLNTVDQSSTSRGSDEIRYKINYTLDTVSGVTTRDVIIKGTLNESESKYARFKKVRGNNITSTLSNNDRTIEIEARDVPLGQENEITLLLVITNAPNGYTVNPNLSIKEATENDETVINTQDVVVSTRSITGVVVDEKNIPVRNVELSLNDINGEIKRTYTDENGNYIFSDITDGTYRIDLEEEIYELTSQSIIEGEGELNLKVKEVTPYEIEAHKYITNLDLVINGREEHYSYNDLEKVVQTVKNAKTISGEITYKITLKNIGGKVGKLSMLKDKVDDGLKFDATKNSGWELKEKGLYYSAISNVSIAPLETREIILKLDIKDTNEIKTYINTINANGDTYEKVVYILDGVKYKEENVLLGETIKEEVIQDDRFTGWYTDKNLTNKYNFNNEVTKDLILYGHLERPTYNIKFVDKNPSTGALNPWSEQNVEEGKKATEPASPSHTGYKFECWMDEHDNIWDFDVDTVQRDMTLTSCYSVIRYEIKYHGLTEQEETALNNPKYYTIEDTVSITDANDRYEDNLLSERFTGWTGSNGDNPSKGISFSNETGDKEYTANWETIEPDEYQISYVLNGGVLEEGKTNPTKYTKKTPTFTLNNPTKPHHNFLGWTGSNGNVPELEVTMVKGENEGDKEFIANFEMITHRVTFKDKDPENPKIETSSDFGQPVTVNDGDAVDAPQTNPTHTGFTCDRWSTKIDGDYNDDAYNFNNEVASDLVLYTLCKRNTYTVTFETYGGTPVPADQTVEYNRTATEPETDPDNSINHKIFLYWSENQVDPYDFSTLVTGNKTLHAIYETVEPPVISHAPTIWTNQDVTVTVSNQGTVGKDYTGYTYQYRKEDETLHNYTNSFTVEKNMDVYAVSVKSEILSEEVKHEIRNIDKVKPTIVSFDAGNISSDSFDINVQSYDSESGLKKIEVYNSDTDALLDTINFTFTPENGGPTTEQSSVSTLTGLTPDTTYNIKIVVTDVAGNIKESEPISVKTSENETIVAQITHNNGVELSEYIPLTSVRKGLTYNKGGVNCGVTNQCTIQMLANVSESNEVLDGQDITLDLNGYTINGAPTVDYTFNNNGDFTVIDTKNQSIEEGELFVDHIKTLYNTDSSIIIDGTSDANYRYTGSSPKNYVRFNGELWRIVGVMNNVKNSDDDEGVSKIKLVRANSIGQYSWDSSASTVNGGNGVNEWSNSDIMKLLNPGFEDEANGGSLYWNSNSGYCYNSSSNRTTTCNFTATGLSDEAKEMIDYTTFNIGTTGRYANNYLDPADVMYFEKATSGAVNCSSGSYCNDTIERTYKWDGYVGLISPLDYLYATGGSGCTSAPNSWSNSCKNLDWLNTDQWTTMPSGGTSSKAQVVVLSSKVLLYQNAYLAKNIFPTVYLNPNLYYKSGTGTSSDPFVIMTEGDYYNKIANQSNGIVNSVDSAIKNTGNFTLGKIEQTDDEVSVTKPYIQGERYGIQTEKTFNFYDGMIKGNIAISDEVSDTPYPHNAVVNATTEEGIKKEIATLRIVSDPEARIRGVYYSRVQKAVDSAKNGTYVDTYTDATFVDSLQHDTNQFFEYDPNNNWYVSNAYVTQSAAGTAKSYVIIDLTDYEYDQELYIDTTKDRSTDSGKIIIRSGDSTGTSLFNQNVDSGDHQYKFVLPKGQRYYVEFTNTPQNGSTGKMYIKNMQLADYKYLELDNYDQDDLNTNIKNYSFVFDENTKSYKSNNRYVEKSTAFSYIEVDLTNEANDKLLLVSAILESYGSDVGSVRVTETNDYYDDDSYSILYMKGKSNTFNKVGPYQGTKVLSKGHKYYIQFYYNKDKYNSKPPQSAYEGMGNRDQFIINNLRIVDNVDSSDLTYSGTPIERVNSQVITEDTYGFSCTSYSCTPTNYGVEGSIAHSYIPIDLTDVNSPRYLRFRPGDGYYNFKVVVTDNKNLPSDDVKAEFESTVSEKINDYYNYFGANLVPGRVNYVHLISKYETGAASFTLDNIDVFNGKVIGMNNLKTAGSYGYEFDPSYGGGYVPTTTPSGNYVDSYIKIDLTNETQDQLVSTNMKLYSGDNIEYLYVTSNGKNIPFTNLLGSSRDNSLIYYSYNDVTYPYYSNNGSNMVSDYKLFNFVLPKGNVYYLHYGTYANSSLPSYNVYDNVVAPKALKLTPVSTMSDYKIGNIPVSVGTEGTESGSDSYTPESDIVDENLANSIDVYPFRFDETTSTYVSTNAGKTNSIASSYITIDMTSETANKDIKINYDVSSSSDYGYINIFKNTFVPMTIDEISSNSLVSASGTGTYSKGNTSYTLEAGSVYYIQFTYYKKSTQQPTASIRDDFRVSLTYRDDYTPTDAYTRYDGLAPELNQEADIVHLLRNVTLTSPLNNVETRNVILNLDGYELTNGQNNYVVINSGQLKIIDEKHEAKEETNRQQQLEYDAEYEEQVEKYNQLVPDPTSVPSESIKLFQGTNSYVGKNIERVSSSSNYEEIKFDYSPTSTPSQKLMAIISKKELELGTNYSDTLDDTDYNTVVINMGIGSDNREAIDYYVGLVPEYDASNIHMDLSDFNVYERITSENNSMDRDIVLKPTRPGTYYVKIFGSSLVKSDYFESIGISSVKLTYSAPVHKQVDEIEHTGGIVGYNYPTVLNNEKAVLELDSGYIDNKSSLLSNASVVNSGTLILNEDSKIHSDNVGILNQPTGVIISHDGTVTAYDGIKNNSTVQNTISDINVNAIRHETYGYGNGIDTTTPLVIEDSNITSKYHSNPYPNTIYDPTKNNGANLVHSTAPVTIKNSFIGEGLTKLEADSTIYNTIFDRVDVRVYASTIDKMSINKGNLEMRSGTVNNSTIDGTLSTDKGMYATTETIVTNNTKINDVLVIGLNNDDVHFTANYSNIGSLINNIGDVVINSTDVNSIENRSGTIYGSATEEIDPTKMGTMVIKNDSKIGVVNNNGILTVGENDGTVSKDYPIIQSNSSSILTSNPANYETVEFNFYDGKIIGKKQNAIKSLINAVPINHDLNVDINGDIETITLKSLDSTDKNDYVARIGNTYYTTLQSAVAAVNDNGTKETIVILKPIYAIQPVTIPSTKNIEIDIDDNYFMTYMDDKYIENNGTVAFTNVSTPTNNSSNHARNFIINNGTLSMDKFYFNTMVREHLFTNNGTMNITSGYVNLKGTNESNVVVTWKTLIENNANATLNINDTDFENIENVYNDFDSMKYIVMVNNYGTAVIEGDNIFNTGCAVYNQKNSIATINHGRILGIVLNLGQMDLTNIVGGNKIGYNFGTMNIENADFTNLINVNSDPRYILSPHYESDGVKESALDPELTTLLTNPDTGYVREDGNLTNTGILTVSNSTFYTQKNENYTYLVNALAAITTMGNSTTTLEGNKMYIFSGAKGINTKIRGPLFNFMDNSVVNIVSGTFSNAGDNEGKVYKDYSLARGDMNIRDNSVVTIQDMDMYNATINVNDTSTLNLNGGELSNDNRDYGIIVDSGATLNVGKKDGNMIINNPFVKAGTAAIKGNFNFYDGTVGGGQSFVDGTPLDLETSYNVITKTFYLGYESHLGVSDIIKNKTMEDEGATDYIYSDIAQAFNDARNNDELVMISNGVILSTDPTITIPANKKLTLDLDDNSIVIGNSKFIENNGELIIKNTGSSDKAQLYSYNGTIVDNKNILNITGGSCLLSSSDTNAVMFNNTGTFTLESNLDFKSGKNAIVNTGTLNITDTSGNNSKVYQNDIENVNYMIDNTGTVTIAGGKFNSSLGGIIDNKNTGSATISDGIFKLRRLKTNDQTQATPMFNNINQSTLYIVNGDFDVRNGQTPITLTDVTNDKVVANYVLIYNKDNAQVTIDDATYKGIASPVIYNDSVAVINDISLVDSSINTISFINRIHGNLTINKGCINGNDEDNTPEYNQNAEYGYLHGMIYNLGTATIKNVKASELGINEPTGTLRLEKVTLSTDVVSNRHSNTRINRGTLNVFESTFNCLELTNNSNTTFKDSTVKGDLMLKDSSNLTIEDTDLLQLKEYYVPRTSGVIPINNNTCIAKDTNLNETTLCEQYSPLLIESNGTINLKSGSIVSKSSVGVLIKANPTINIGDYDNAYDINQMVIEGDWGLAVPPTREQPYSPTVNFYDGKIIGTQATNVNITNVEDNYHMTYDVNDSIETLYLSMNKLVENTRTQVEYYDLQTAITEANSMDTLKVKNNFVIKDPATNKVVIPSGKTITLDFNNKKVYASTTDFITNNGTLNIVDSSNGTGTFVTENNFVVNNGTLTVSAGVYENINAITNNGTLTVNGGTFNNSTILNNASSSMTVSGGNFNYENMTGAYHNINNQGYYIADGNIRYIILNYGNLDITNGIFNYNTFRYTYHDTADHISVPAVLNMENANLHITGGEFDKKVNELDENEASIYGEVVYNHGIATIENIKPNTYALGENTGTLNVKNVTMDLNVYLERQKIKGAVFDNYDGTLTIEDSNIKLKSDGFSMIFNDEIHTNGEVIIKNSTLQGDTEGIFIRNGHTLTIIDDTTITNTTGDTIRNGGTLTLGTSGIPVSEEKPYISGNNIVINNYDRREGISGTINYYDGLLKGRVTGTIANTEEDYGVLWDSTTQSYKLTYMADVEKVIEANGINFTSIQDVINSCTPGTVVDATLFSNVELEEPLNVPEGVTINIYLNEFTLTPEEYVNNHTGTGSIYLISESQSGLGGSIYRFLANITGTEINPKNIIIYQMEDGNELDPADNYKLYRLIDGEYKLVKVDENSIGYYEIGKETTDLRTVNGQLRVNGIGEGEYKLVGGGRELEFSITENGISNNIRENRYASKAKVTSTAIATLILQLQTGVMRKPYIVLILLVVILVLGAIALNQKQKREDYEK